MIMSNFNLSAKSGFSEYQQLTAFSYTTHSASGLGKYWNLKLYQSRKLLWFFPLFFKYEKKQTKKEIENTTSRLHEFEVWF